MDIKKKLLLDITEALRELKVDGIDPIVTRSPNVNRGDYSTNVALQASGTVPGDRPSVKLHRAAGEYKDPMDLALKIKGKLEQNETQTLIDKLDVANPGFINFWIKDSVWQKEVEEVLKIDQLNLGVEKRKIVVEFAHPNTHKLFHIGHLRNIATGEAICRLLEALGNKVSRVNYQGDVGLHIAKALWGIKKLGFKKPKDLDEKVKFLSEAYVLGNKAYEDPSAKEEIDEINKKLYENDPELTKLQQETKQWSLDYFDAIYRRVGTKFDRLYFESEVAEPGRKEVLKFVKKGIFVESEGAIIFPGEKFGLHNRVFINSRGLPTYEAKDVGLATLQFKEYSPDLVIHVVGPEQKGYFDVLFKALGQIYPETRGKELHLVYGWVKLKSGKMSSRTGDVVTGAWLLDEAKKKALKILEQSKISKDVNKDAVSEQVAVGGVKYAMLKLGLNQDLTFDFETSINLNGDSGPYLQYTFARCQSVLEKGGKATDDFSVDAMEESERELLSAVGFFQETVLDAGLALAPNILMSYLYELAQKYNLFYNNLPIIKAEEKIRSRRLALTAACAKVIEQGLYLLGISAPEKM